MTESSTNQKPTIIREDNKEAPIVTKVDKPEVRGVLIVAKGADNIEVKKNDYRSSDADTRRTESSCFCFAKKTIGRNRSGEKKANSMVINNAESCRSLVCLLRNNAG
ncbi:hypothetical protein GCM10020331_040760 [Ectobacillus funiculus]